MTKIDGLEIVMTKQMQKMIDKELKKRFEELKPELATRYEELLNMRNMEADQFNDGFNDARAGKLETDHPHYDLDTDNWRLGYAYGMFEPMKEKLAREHQLSDALYLLLVDDPNTKLKAEQILIDIYGKCEPSPSDVSVTQDVTTPEPPEDELRARIAELEAENDILKDHLREAKNILIDKNLQIDSLYEAGYKLQQRIAELEAESERFTVHSDIERQDDKWIPVSERLPDNWESVLTIDISKSTRDMVTAFYNPETSLWSTHFSCDLWVTHWMPLPEPPILYGKVCEE